MPETDDQSPPALQHRVSSLEEKVEEGHDPRITRNERWRLQAQGALKIVGVILGAGGLTYVVSLV